MSDKDRKIILKEIEISLREYKHMGTEFSGEFRKIVLRQYCICAHGRKRA